MSKTINQNNLNATLRMLEKMGQANLERVKSSDPEQAEHLEKLDALFTNEDFCKALFACTDKQEAVKLFADNGVVLTEEAVELLTAQIKSMVQKLMDQYFTSKK